MSMPNRRAVKVTLPAVVVLAGLVLAAGVAPVPAARSSVANDVPRHHSSPPAAPLPETLDPAQFADGLTKNAYAMAARIKPVLYQQPCYCLCDRTEGHQSLLDCFLSTHAAMCNICRMEAIFAYEQTRAGQTPAQIRKAIIHGDWKKLDPRDYQIARDLP